MYQGGKKTSPPLRCELECVATAKEVKALPADELNRRVHEAMQRDDYAYQRAEGIEIKNPRRADGLHNILYQCPHCGKEFMMYSEGTRLWCASCGKEARVPFKPREDRPVYCSECFAKMREE